MRSVLASVKKCDFLNHTFITHSKCDHMCDHTFIFAWVAIIILGQVVAQFFVNCGSFIPESSQWLFMKFSAINQSVEKNTKNDIHW